MTQHRIWYKLVNSDGSAHKGHTASEVDVPEGANVDRLRKEVKKENDQPGYLKDIPSGALLVYSSIQALNDREEHLKASALVGDMGAGEEHALAVVVPASGLSSRSSSEASIAKIPVNADRLKRWTALNSVLTTNRNSKRRKGVNDDEDSSMPYSSASWNSVAPIFDAITETYKEPVVSVPLDMFALLSKYLSVVMKCYGTRLVQGNEAKRMHLISPIIMCVVWNLPDVVVEVEADLNGNQVHAHGHFEFVLTRGRKRICIVEAKQGEMKKGFAQNLIGCEVAVDLDGSDMVVGVVTDFHQWIFIKSMNEKILVDEENLIGFDQNEPNAQNLKTVAGKLYSILNE